MVMAESTVVENPKANKPPRRVNHIKMQVVPDLKADTATEIVKEKIDYQSEIQSDDSTTYKKFEQVVKAHIAQVVKPEELQKVMPWVHICIGNVKRLLLNMHHQLKKEYLCESRVKVPFFYVIIFQLFSFKSCTSRYFLVILRC